MRSYIRILSLRSRPIFCGSKLPNSNCQKNFIYSQKEISSTSAVFSWSSRSTNISLMQSNGSNALEEYSPGEVLNEESGFKEQLEKVESVTDLVEKMKNTFIELTDKQILAILSHARSLENNSKKSVNSEDKENKSNIESAVNSEELIMLCKMMEKFLPVLQPHTILGIHSVSRELIPPTNCFMHKVLKLIIENFNKFLPHQVLNLYLGIKKKKWVEPSFYIQPLELACLQYMEHKFARDFMALNLSRPSVANYWTLISSKTFIPHFTRCLILVQVMKQDFSKWNLDILSNILYSLFLNKPHGQVDAKVIKDFLTILKHKLNGNNLITLKRIFFAYLIGCEHKIFTYDEQLCDKLASLAISSNMPLDMLLLFTKLLCYVKHLNVPLVDHVRKQFFETINDGLVDNNDLLSIIYIFANVGIVKMKNVNWNYYKMKLTSLVANLKLNANERSALKTTLNLATMGILDKVLYDRVFNDALMAYKSGKYKDWSRGHITSFLLLYQYVSILHPSYQLNLFSKEELTDISNLIAKNHLSFVWKEKIEKFFGGEEYVLKNCTTSYNHALCYVVLLDSNTLEPVNVAFFKKASPEGIIDIEKFVKAGDAEIVVIQEFDCSIYLRNVPVLCGQVQLFVNVLEALGYHAMPISLNPTDRETIAAISSFISKIKRRVLREKNYHDVERS